uniref:ABC transporter permease subunit n=1 Tax=Ignisphaera aggregans TaxID=334771 RepID=A0A7C5UZH6_9CREN
MIMTRKDKLFFISLLPLSSSLLAILILSIATIALKSLDSLQIFGFNLLTSSIWNPEKGIYGLLAPLIGSVITSILAVFTALVLSLPLSIIIVEYLRGIVKNIVSSIVELMGGMPTIIYAVWASQYLVPFLKEFLMEPLHNTFKYIPLFSCRPITGFSIFATGLSIGISIIPYVTTIILEAYQSIPLAYREACYGIGATRYESIKIMLSLARPAIIAALILGFARSLGETTIAAVTVGNSMYLSSCLFAPGYTVSALIASQFANAYLYPYAESVLYASILFVVLISVALSFYGSSIIIRWRSKIVV